MKLIAPADLLEALHQRGLLCRPDWPVPAPDYASVAGADLVIGGSAAAECALADVLPLPCALATLSGVVAGWWARSGSRRAALLVLSGGDTAGSGILETADACSADLVLAELRRLYGRHSGEWNDLPGGAAGTLIEWRFLAWTWRVADPADGGLIEVELPLGESPSAACGSGGAAWRPCSLRERPGSARRRLVERVERIERRPGSVLLHLDTASGVAGSGLLASPIRLPKTLEVGLVTAVSGR